ncbi:MbcA/ParS/Xre antitoxin family protein [Mesoterricola silvestris]|uniref:DUF2384 domain-containing protein n=1 Tax=Mesoterricola silvestris TaxID=2927979 RepID=A0AA48GKR8_9BACT|nr:MbcA/ParS/Xre antitoxin family protein [Mesoterricola silvestris]BDU73014.1 hypothetical protein METEAL_21880 [Mesoterricola silvestris]
MALPNSTLVLPEPPEALALAGAGLRAFGRMAAFWGLSVDEQRLILGGLPRTTYYGLLKGTVHSVTRDTLERLSLLMGIWANLEILVPDPAAAAAWMRRPNPDHRFGGAAPLGWILQGTLASLVDVRRYLEAWRSGA